MISVRDFKGEELLLNGPISTTTSRSGLTEMKFLVKGGILENYEWISVPVFDAWWVDPQWETYWDE